MPCLQNKLTYMVYKLFDNLEIISLFLKKRRRNNIPKIATVYIMRVSMVGNHANQ